MQFEVHLKLNDLKCFLWKEEKRRVSRFASLNSRCTSLAIFFFTVHFSILGSFNSEFTNDYIHISKLVFSFGNIHVHDFIKYRIKGCIHKWI